MKFIIDQQTRMNQLLHQAVLSIRVTEYGSSQSLLLPCQDQLRFQWLIIVVVSENTHPLKNASTITSMVVSPYIST